MCGHRPGTVVKNVRILLYMEGCDVAKRRRWYRPHTLATGRLP